MRWSLLCSIALVVVVSFLFNVESEKPIGEHTRDSLSARFATTLGDPRYDWKELIAPSASGTFFWTKRALCARAYFFCVNPFL